MHHSPSAANWLCPCFLIRNRLLQQKTELYCLCACFFLWQDIVNSCIFYIRASMSFLLWMCEASAISRFQSFQLYKDWLLACLVTQTGICYRLVFYFILIITNILVCSSNNAHIFSSYLPIEWLIHWKVTHSWGITCVRLEKLGRYQKCIIVIIVIFYSKNNILCPPPKTNKKSVINYSTSCSSITQPHLMEGQKALGFH